MLSKQKQNQLTKILESQKVIKLNKKIKQKEAIIKQLRLKIKQMEGTKTDCTAKSICNVFKEGNCKGYPCPGYTT